MTYLTLTLTMQFQDLASVWKVGWWWTGRQRKMADDGKCAHGGCECAVQGDAVYCSEYCENAEDTGVAEIACGCSHPDCKV